MVLQQGYKVAVADSTVKSEKAKGESMASAGNLALGVTDLVA